MNKIHKTLAVAAAAVIAGINVWNVHDSSRKMDLILGDVEYVAQAEWTWNNICDWWDYGLRRDETVITRPCPEEASKGTSNSGGGKVEGGNGATSGSVEGYGSSSGDAYYKGANGREEKTCGPDGSENCEPQSCFPN